MIAALKAVGVHHITSECTEHAMTADTSTTNSSTCDRVHGPITTIAFPVLMLDEPRGAFDVCF